VPDPERADQLPRTVGVEEELLLYVRGTTHLALHGDDLADPEPVAATAGEHPDQTVEHEFKRAQIESATSPQVRMVELREEVEAGRREINRRAAAHDLVLAALATDPARSVPITTRDDRYQRMVQLYGAVADSQLACGLHIHVAVASPDEGVQVIDRLRPWLPGLLALSANSPFHRGRDTEYASYRNVMWGLWPTSGPTDLFGSAAVYRERVHELVRSGAAVDEAMIYFDARLSARYPTVEIRVMDAVPTAAEATLLAALCRGLVDAAADDVRRDRPAPEVSRAMLRAMTWRAARFGLTEQLVRPDGSALADAADVVGELVDHAYEALGRAGDLDLVARGVAHVLETGSGAARQRKAFAQNGSLFDVVSAAVDWTTWADEV
jgi:glutamate---cysteine ligase / carboxylate-amine ligase